MLLVPSYGPAGHSPCPEDTRQAQGIALPRQSSQTSVLARGLIGAVLLNCGESERGSVS